MKFVPLLAATALSTIAVLGASAADMPARQQPASAPFADQATWTGFYMGANAGYGWGHSKFSNDDVSVSGFRALAGSLSANHANGLGGLQAGFNTQFAPNWVAGVETDFQWSGQRLNASGAGALNLGVAPNAAGVYGTLANSRMSWFGTVRGRVGVVPGSLSQTMIYATGGLAYGHVSASYAATASGVYTSNCEGCTGPFSGALTGSQAGTRLGWTLGGGIETKVDAHWSFKAEYLHIDLGRTTGTIALAGSGCHNGCGPIASSISYSSRVASDVFRIGVNYRFGS